jgi:pimeloyl-ACP methyl ester carboxylesterase
VSNYARIIDALAGRFRVIVPDMPGYGRSSKDIDHDDPFGDLASAIGGLLDELGLDQAHLVGNSDGGAAALRLAMDRPGRPADPDGAWWYRHHPCSPDQGPQQPPELLRRPGPDPEQPNQRS